jgi:L-ascorbate metabolism protein UlaG (beta-lactamase superfamily)
MKIKYFTNSMVLISGNNLSILCDPWITFDAKSNTNLYNFPETKYTKKEIKDIKPDYIYITHTHADHFDKNTLELFSKDTPVLCADYENNFTERNLKSLGFKNVIVCKKDETFKFNDLDECNLFVAEINPEVDSFGIFKIDGTTMLNANDVIHSKKQMDEIGKNFNIDLAMIPYAYQGPYPAFYENLSSQDRKLKANEKKVRNYEVMSKFIESTKPNSVFPFAAGCVYGGKKAKQYAYYGVGTADEAIKYCKDKGQTFREILINNGTEYDFETGKTSSEFKPIAHVDQVDYLNRISKNKSIFDEEFVTDKLEKFYPHNEIGSDIFIIGRSHHQNLTRILKKARSNQIKWQNKMKIVSDKSFYIDVGHEHLYRLSLSDDSVQTIKENEIEDQNYEIFRCSYSLLIGLITGHFNYSNMKTGLMSFYRKPDNFDPNIHILMSYFQL